MPIGPCRECGKSASEDAKSCPHCGVSNPVQPSNKNVLIGIGFIVSLIVLGKLISSAFDAPQVQATPTPEEVQRQAEAARIAAQEEELFQHTASAVRAVKASLRDPESVVWESIRTDRAASVVCIQYRAKNGFGGMTRETALVTGREIFHSDAAYKKFCTPDLVDMIKVRHAVR